MTDNAQAEMVGRLLVMYSHRGDGIPTQYINPNGPEAAAEIERMAREVAALREALGKIADGEERRDRTGCTFVEDHPDAMEIARQALATSMAQGRGIDPASAID